MNVYIIALFLALTIIVLAKLIFDRLELSRFTVWGVVLFAYSVMHYASIDQPPLLRTILLCAVLIAGMKWVSYSEWRKRSGAILPWGRWLCFATLWFGMEPMEWTIRRHRIQWKVDVFWGSVCCLTGGSLVFFMSTYKISQLIPLFIAMSIGFHFGALRLHTAFWRFQGFPVRALFRNPFRSFGFTDFWKKRWNLAYSQMMVRAVKRPIEQKYGTQVALFCVFTISGLLHELAITVPVQAGYGLPTSFFVVQGIFTALEKNESLLNALLCGISLVLGLHFLFPAAFVTAVILPARDVFNLLNL